MLGNPTIAELEANRCASDELLTALTSKLMIGNHIFLLLVIISSIIATGFAFRMLWNHSVFSSCARKILWATLISGLFHQFAMGVVRVRSMYRAIVYSNDSCSILFHASECFIQNHVIYTSNIFTCCAFLVLLLDRIFSFRLRSFYASSQLLFTVLFLSLQFACSVAVVLWIFQDDPFVGYVPFCFYPPPPALERFSFVGNIRTVSLFVLLFVFLFILFLNNKREKRMIHNVFNTHDRYKSYENVLTTRAVCLTLFTQLISLGPTSFLGIVLIHIKQHIPAYLYNSILSFLAGTTYSALTLPIAINYITGRIIRQRNKAIDSLKLVSATRADDHFESICKQWGVEKTSVFASNNNQNDKNEKPAV